MSVSAVLLTACPSEVPRPPAPPVAPPPPPILEPAAPAARFELPDRGYRLAWISEASGAPQIAVDGVTITSGAAHYLSAVGGEGLLVTRSRGESEEMIVLSLDGGTRSLSPASTRARSATSAKGRVLFEGAGAGLSSLFNEKGVAVVDDAAGSFEPSLAPDGTWFAFVSSRDGDAEIYRAAIDGGAQRRLTAFHLDDVSPRVSPDGKWILFVSNREGSDRLFLVRPDGRGQRRLHEATIAGGGDGGVEAAEADAVWSPDSKSVVFSARPAGGHWHLFRADVAKATISRLTEGEFDDQVPAISPDGRSIVFVSDRAADTELYSLDHDGGVSRVTYQVGADWKPLWLAR